MADSFSRLSLVDFQADFSPVVRLFREAVARDVHPLSLLVLVLVLRLDVVV